MNTPPAKVPVTPAGNPVAPAPVPLPPIAYVIFVIAVPAHFVCALVPAAELKIAVAFAFTLIDFVNAVLAFPDL